MRHKFLRNCLIIAGVAFVFLYFIHTNMVMSLTKAKSRFAKTTGITITDDCDIIGYKYDFDFLDDEFGFGVKVPSIQISNVIHRTPPFGHVWQRGPVNGNIGIYCTFIYSNSVMYAPNTKEYFGISPSPAAILSSSNTWYCAEPFGSGNSACEVWRGGRLLVVDPPNSNIWLSVWHN